MRKNYSKSDFEYILKHGDEVCRNQAVYWLIHCMFGVDNELDHDCYAISTVLTKYPNEKLIKLGENYFVEQDEIINSILIDLKDIREYMVMNTKIIQELKKRIDRLYVLCSGVEIY